MIELQQSQIARHSLNKSRLKEILGHQRKQRVALQLSSRQKVLQADIDKSQGLVVEYEFQKSASLDRSDRPLKNLYFAPSITSQLITERNRALKRPVVAQSANLWNQLGEMSTKYCQQLMPPNIVKMEESVYHTLAGRKPMSHGSQQSKNGFHTLNTRSKSVELQSSSLNKSGFYSSKKASLNNTIIGDKAFVDDGRIQISSDEVVFEIQPEVSAVHNLPSDPNRVDISLPTLRRMGSEASDASYTTNKVFKSALSKPNQESNRLVKTVRIQENPGIDTAKTEGRSVSQGVPRLLISHSRSLNQPEKSDLLVLREQSQNHFNLSHEFRPKKLPNWTQIRESRKSLSTSLDINALKALTIGKLEPVTSAQLKSTEFFKHVQKYSPLMRDRFRDMIACKRGATSSLAHSSESSGPLQKLQPQTLLRAKVILPTRPKHSKPEHRPLADETFDEGARGEAFTVQLQMAEVEQKVADEIDMYGATRGFNKRRQFHVYQNTCGLNYSPPFRSHT